MTYRRSPQDIAFDSVYPAAVRLLSRRFWTPLEVGPRAAELFLGVGSRRVLDVGSGVGKFALAAAAAAPGVEFVGVERRTHLVTIARRAQAKLEVPNVRFFQGDAAALDWASFDGLYFFNPFAENLFDPEDRIDDDLALCTARFHGDVRRVERGLQKLRMGTEVVTITAPAPGSPPASTW